MERNLDWAPLDTRGITGGILFMWDSKVLEQLSMEVGSFSISLPWPQLQREGRCGRSSSQLEGFGKSPGARFSEKWNYSWMSSTMEFLGFIDEFDLVDLCLGGGAYT